MPSGCARSDRYASSSWYLQMTDNKGNRTNEQHKHEHAERFSAQVHVQRIVFQCHPLMSKEEHLASELRALCARFHEQNFAQCRRNIASRLLEAEQHVSDTDVTESDVSNLIDELDSIAQEEHDFCKRIQTVNQELTAQREQQGYSTTQIIATLEQEMFIEEERRTAEFTRRLESDIEEARRMHDEAQKKKQFAKARRERLQRQRTMNASASSTADTHEAQECMEEFDEEAAKARLLASMDRNGLGSPTCGIQLNDEEQTSKRNLPASARKRIEQIRGRILSCALVCNDIEISRRSVEGFVYPTFEANIDSVFTLSVAEWPQRLRIQLWEGRRRSARTMLAEVQVNLPDAGWNDQKSDHAFRRVEFSNTEYHLNGSPREQRGWTNRSNENIKGEIWIQTQWLQEAHDDIETGRPHVPLPAKNVQSDGNEDSCVREGKEMKSQAPRRVEAVSDARRKFSCLLRQLDKNGADVDMTQRIALLQARWRGGVPLGRPAMPYAVTQETLQHYEQNVKREEDATLRVRTLANTDVEKERAKKLAEYLFALKASIDRHERGYYEDVVGRTRKIEDVVREPILPASPRYSLLTGIGKLFEPRRKLKPRKHKQKSNIPVQRKNDGHELLVSVQKAYSLPSPDEPNQSQKDAFLSPVVQVEFQGVRRLTKRSEGSNPIWNEQLSIPVKVPGKEVTAESVAGLDESIKVSLFDQRATDISNGREGSEEGEVTRFSNHYLGSTHIPFQSFYRTKNQRLECHATIAIPTVLLGYRKNGEVTTIGLYVVARPQFPPYEFTGTAPPSSEDEKLTADASAWEQYASSKGKERRTVGLAPHMPFSVESDLESSNTGLTRAAVMRFVTPLDIPETLLSPEDSETSMQAVKKLCRFVSLLPACKQAEALRVRQDVWMNVNQITALFTALYHDRALLLCSLLLGAGHKAYVLLGTGIVDRSLAYVLVKTSGQGLSREEPTARSEGEILCNPTSGRAWERSRRMGDMVDVGCAFNNRDVYANLQTIGNPATIALDFDRKNEWAPMRSAKGIEPAALDPIATPSTPALFRQPAKDYVAACAHAVERHVMEAIRDSRAKLGYETKPNMRIARTLQKLLESGAEGNSNIEREIISDQTKMDQTLHDRLASSHYQIIQSASPRIGSSREITGFALDLRYLDMKEIKDHVLSTRVQTLPFREAEFSVAAHTVSYPGDMVIALWLYVVCIHQKATEIMPE